MQFKIGAWCRMRGDQSNGLWRVTGAEDGHHLVTCARLTEFMALGMRTDARSPAQLILTIPTQAELAEWRTALASVGLALAEDIGRPIIHERKRADLVLSLDDLPDGLREE